FMYRPVRYRSPDTLRASIARGLAERETIGLVGAEMASLPGVAALCQEVAARGGRASPSSLKADLITPALARALGAGGNRSVTVAPEAGSERMRRVINKNLSEAEILRAAEWLVGGGVDALKLYVMVGLPTETDEDVEAIVDLTAKVRARLAGSGRPRVGRILVSINPFVPKPWTRTASSTAPTPSMRCCPGTSSNTRSTSATCSRSAARRSASCRRRPAIPPPATPAARASVLSARWLYCDRRSGACGGRARSSL